MALLAISKDTIRANVILYFHNEFGDPISWFTGKTNVRKGYRYTPEQWKAVGRALSGLPWMTQLAVTLPPKEMPPLSTIDDITNAIWNKLHKVVMISTAGAALKPRSIKVLAPVAVSAGRARQATRTAKRSKAKAKRPERAGAKRRKSAAMKRPKRSKR